MIRLTNDNSTSNSLSRTNAIAWCVGALLAAALVGLIHDRNYATASGADTVEDGRGVEDPTVMDEGLGAAQIGRVIGLGFLITAGGICVLTMPAETRIRWDGFSYLMVLGLLWGTASVLWSVEPSTTARALVRVFVYVGVAVSLARRFDPRTLCYVLVIALGGSALTSVLYEIGTGGFRPWQSGYRLTGSMHSNVLGVQTAVIAIIAYAFAVRRNPQVVLWWTVFVVAFVVVYLTKARTALITVIAGAIVVHVVGRPMRSWLMLATAGAALLAVVVLGGTMLGQFDGREAQFLTSLGRTDDAGDLTGRVPLWSYIWEQSADRRWQGFGCGAFWVIERTLAAHDALEWYPRHSHNAYLQIVVNLGIVGLVIALTVGVWALMRTKRLIERTGLPEYSALAGILVGMFVNGCAESVFVMPRDMGLISAVVVFSVAVVHRRVEAPSRSKASATQLGGESLWGRHLEQPQLGTN